MFDILDSILRDQIDSFIGRPHWVDTQSPNKLVEVRIQFDTEILRVFFRRKQAYAANAHIFIVWMVTSSIILLFIAVMFLRNQIRPILQLSEAADRFGKGLAAAKGISSLTAPLKSVRRRRPFCACVTVLNAMWSKEPPCWPGSPMICAPY